MATTNASAGTELDPARLDLLLHKYGIASEFIEFSGNIARIALEHRLHILGTMGVTVGSPEELEALIAARELEEFGNWLPPTYVVNEGDTAVNITEQVELAGGALLWELRLEDGRVHSGSFAPADLPLVSVHEAGHRYEKRQLALPELPLGYHWLSIGDGRKSHDCLLIVAPRQTWQPDCTQRGRCWGLSVQLYSLKSADNWGMGDFGDLLRLVELAAANGADFVLLNPLHVLDLRYPENASPYSPSDRRFLNPLYIAAALCPDHEDAAVQAAIASASFGERLEALQASANVDYKGVHCLKFRVLKLMYQAFCRTLADASNPRVMEFKAFVDDGGDALQIFARHQVAMLGGEGICGELDFHLYLQWVAFMQLQACQQAAIAAGMPIGLIRDLAVGSIVDGCEVMTNPELFCTGARIGAPPDNFNPDGQNWGLPPLDPEALLESRCEHFITLVRTNMQSCGALRIDHVMALMRLWWCPDDGSNASGAYVHYPVDALFAILRLESCRNRCAVIGEDLGVVPPEIRDYLEGGAVFSNCVFYFEKYDGWHFRKPEHYKEQALTMIANHDVPPLLAWWNVSDLDLRREIGLIPNDEQLRTAQEYRKGEKQQLLQWLDEQGLLPASWQDRNADRQLDAELALALVTACGRVKSKLLSLQLDDLAGIDTPVNIPGTCGEYANWRRKIPVALEGIFTNILAQEMLKAMREARTE